MIIVYQQVSQWFYSKITLEQAVEIAGIASVLETDGVVISAASFLVKGILSCQEEVSINVISIGSYIMCSLHLPNLWTVSLLAKGSQGASKDIKLAWGVDDL